MSRCAALQPSRARTAVTHSAFPGRTRPALESDSSGNPGECSPACPVTTTLVCIRVMHPESRNSIPTEPCRGARTASYHVCHRRYVHLALASTLHRPAAKVADTFPAVPSTWLWSNRCRSS